MWGDKCKISQMLEKMCMYITVEIQRRDRVVNSFGEGIFYLIQLNLAVSFMDRGRNGQELNTLFKHIKATSRD